MDGREPLEPEKKSGIGRRLVALIRSWFELTSEEQAVLLIVVGLLLLGLTVRYWRMLHKSG